MGMKSKKQVVERNQKIKVRKRYRFKTNKWENGTKVRERGKWIIFAYQADDIKLIFKAKILTVHPMVTQHIYISWVIQIMVVGDCTSRSKNNQKILFHLNLYRGHFNTVNTSSHILFLLYLKITTPVLSNSISPHRVQVGAHYTWSLEVNRWPRMKVKIAEESKVKYLGQFLISTWMSFFFFSVFWAHNAHPYLFLLSMDASLCPKRYSDRVQSDEMSPIVIIFSSFHFLLLHQTLSKTSPEKRQRQANPEDEYSTDINPKGRLYLQGLLCRRTRWPWRLV